MACPIIAVVEEKFGNKDVEFTIVGKVAEYSHTTTEYQGDYEIKRKHYIDSGSTKQAKLTIPRYTRQYATFLLIDLGNKIWDLESVTPNVSKSVGKVVFYALASNGSKIIYWFGLHKLAEELKEIIRFWIAPPKCNRCNGTGIEPNTTDEFCSQCGGYKYSGYSSTKKVQRQIGYDVGLSRDVVNWDSMTDAEHDMVFKFINKCWTQKWWVTPTKKEIRRLFAHFYNIPEANILIEERFDMQEPVWNLKIPSRASTASPFGTLDEDDRNLMTYIAESLTPAGVSVFVGFYEIYSFGDISDITDRLSVISYKLRHKSTIEAEYELWGMPRWDFHNGWTKATDDFEREWDLNWDKNGTVEIVNVNDMNRHMARLKDNSYMQTGTTSVSGWYELWVHPQDTDLKIGQINSSNNWMFYVQYKKQDTGWYDNNDALLTRAMPDCDYHISIYFDNNNQEYDVYIQQKPISKGISYLDSGTVDKFRIESIGTGYGFVDAIGLPDDTNYEVGDNFRRLYPWGWGLKNLDYATGITGTVYDLYESYFRRNRFFDLNI